MLCSGSHGVNSTVVCLPIRRPSVPGVYECCQVSGVYECCQVPGVYKCCQVPGVYECCQVPDVYECCQVWSYCPGITLLVC
jgi:hypothetical protein